MNTSTDGGIGDRTFAGPDGHGVRGAAPAHSTVGAEQRRWDAASTTGERDLADRAALRRVAGLSTQLTDISEVEYRELQLERVVLVGVWSGRSGEASAASDAGGRLARRDGVAGPPSRAPSEHSGTVSEAGGRLARRDGSASEAGGRLARRDEVAGPPSGAPSEQFNTAAAPGAALSKQSSTASEADASMTELAALAETAGSVVLDAVMQRRPQPDAATYIGSGKVAELASLVAACGADTVICDGELSAGQLRNLEERLKVKVVDRTALILDIFAQHARSREGKAQVELAQLNYLLPRLRGWGAALSRQRGGRVAGGEGIGSRGPGETKLEIDRRRIGRRIAQLRADLAGMQRVRETKRSARRGRHVPAVAIAGYTNAGKSSLLNRMTGAGVLVQDALFATLDPTTRRARTSDGRIFTLTDTVGFVRHLPHQLVEAFRSTLEEVGEADLIVHVVDGSDARPLDQVAAVREVLVGVDAGEVPELIVVNKIDLADETTLTELRSLLPGAVFVSARTGEGLAELAERIAAALPAPDVPVDVLVPFTAGSLVSRIHAEGTVVDAEHTAAGTRISARVPPALAGALQPYDVTLARR